jgi:hypothetical protein
MGAARGYGVFVSYRREDSGDAAGRLADRLVVRFGAERVFMDVEAIGPGADYVEAITHAVEACAVLVAVIGPGWLTAADKRGTRLENPHDWVRVEVGTALARGVLVIPVLVRDADMPVRGDLPEDLAGLARRNALRIRHDRFSDDVRQLIAAIDQVFAPLAVPDGAEGARPAGDASGASTKEGSGTESTDLARAARLLDDAERIVNSVSESKAWALSSVAKAVAAIDPDRAERIASSITSKLDRALALCGIARVLFG